MPVMNDIKSPSAVPSHSKFIIRPASFFDAHALATMSGAAYADNSINDHIAPYMKDHPNSYVRSFRQSIRRRILAPDTLSIVACPASDPARAVGYAQYTRMGDDQAAKQFARSKPLWQRACYLILSWFFGVWDSVQNYFNPQRCFDPEKLAQLGKWGALDMERYWTSHADRKNRWHAYLITVDPVWQGKGIGRLIVEDVLVRAQMEGVVVGLTASPMGESLYRKMGFERLGDFYGRFTGRDVTDVGGGIMMWAPEGRDL